MYSIYIYTYIYIYIHTYMYIHLNKFGTNNDRAYNVFDYLIKCVGLPV